MTPSPAAAQPIVHLAGPVVDGNQPCVRCGTDLCAAGTPPLTPWEVGGHIEEAPMTYDSHDGRGLRRVGTGWGPVKDAPTCPDRRA